MPTTCKLTGSCRSRGDAFAVMVVLCLLLAYGSADAADEVTPASRYRPTVDVTAASYYLTKDGDSSSYAALTVELGVELTPEDQAFSAGVFAEFEVNSQSTGRYGRMLGSWASYKYRRWSLSSVGAHFDSNDSAGFLLYAGKLQFAPRPRHKFAITAVGALGSSPSLRLSYRTVVGRRASVSLSIGVGEHWAQDFGASTKYDWNLF